MTRDDFLGADAPLDPPALDPEDLAWWKWENQEHCDGCGQPSERLDKGRMTDGWLCPSCAEADGDEWDDHIERRIRGAL